MSAGWQVRGHDAEQAAKILDELVAVYLEGYRDQLGGFHNEDRYRRQLAGHLTNPGWKLATATSGGELIGYAYGFPLPPTTRWWQGLQTPAPEGFTDEDGRRTFAISEIMVRASWRRRGVARSLHDELLSGRTESRATLLVEPANTPAQAAYASWGYRKAAALLPAWENAPTYNALVRPHELDD